MIRFFTAGESHGPGLTIIVEGVPAGLLLSEDYIAVQLGRRQKGYGRGGRMLIEQDRAKIMSGVRHGRTLGSPIGMSIENKDWVNWLEAMAIEYVENPSQEGSSCFGSSADRRRRQATYHPGAGSSRRVGRSTA